jgi:3-oxoacyl-[acyl-carrier protein] reductase
VNWVRNREQGEKVVNEIRAAGGKAILVQCDVTIREQVDALIRQTEAGPARSIYSSTTPT